MSMREVVQSAKVVFDRVASDLRSLDETNDEIALAAAAQAGLG
jgi:hypothetical protein